MGPPYTTGGGGEVGTSPPPSPPPVQATTTHTTAQGTRGTRAPCVRAISCSGEGWGARCSGDCTQAQYARTHHMHTRTREGGRGSESPDCPSRFPPSLCTTASVVPTAPSVAVRWVRQGLAQGVVYYSFPCTCRTRPCGPHTQVRAGG